MSSVAAHTSKFGEAFAGPGGIGDDEDPVVGRRGPFRPGKLVPARARLHARSLSRLFHVIDALAVIAITAVAILVAHLSPA
ncbi:MAG: hypothetical protein J7521_05385, partial [Caulobacter sp.]|nr:hypothetical protein [Caulobacter sp.]